MAHLGEVLQLSPNHHEASQRMQRLSRGMARGAASVGHPAVIETIPADDYADLDLSALEPGNALQTVEYLRRRLQLEQQLNAALLP